MFNKIEFKKTREFGEIINDTIKFIKQNFKPLLTVFIYLCGFFLLATMISSIFQQITMVKTITAATNGANILENYSRIFNFQYYITVLFQLANYTAISVSVISFIAVYVKNGNVAPTVEEVWAYFKYYFFRAFGSSLIIGIFMVICLIPCGIPFIYVFPAVSIILPILILENASFTYSFGRSFKLVKDNWGLTAGAIFILWGITYACMLVSSIPSIIISFAGAFTAGGKGLSTSVIIFTTILQSICQVFLILPTVGVCLCYFNLVERHENAGLFDRINQVDEKKADFNNPGEY